MQATFRAIRHARKAGRLEAFKLGMTVAMGIGIPLLSLAMSRLSGTLASAGMYPLALFALALMLAVLAVSLRHLTWAIEHITRSDTYQSAALAVSLVLCELVGVYADHLGLQWVTYLVMGAVAACSMALNVYAFLAHK